MYIYIYIYNIDLYPIDDTCTYRLRGRLSALRRPGARPMNITMII